MNERKRKDHQSTVKLKLAKASLLENNYNSVSGRSIAKNSF